MVAATSKRLKTASVKHTSLEQTGAFLQALPEKPKEELSLKEAVAQLQDPIRAALAKGYSYQELAAMLAETGIHISAFTLKNYVPSGKRRSNKEQVAPKTTARTGRKAKAEPSPEADQPVKSARSTSEKSPRARASSTSDSTSTPGRGRKTSTAAKTKADTGATMKQSASRRSRQAADPSASSQPVAKSKTTAKAGTSRSSKATS